MKLPVIHPSQRHLWDPIVFAVILLSAFEVPYDVLIGWRWPEIAHGFSWLYFIVFGVDIGLNLLTARPPWPGGAWWGMSVFSRRRRKVNAEELLTTQPAIALAYVRSGWFIIDLLAWVPFDLLFGRWAGLTLLRTLRLVRAARMLRAVKSLRAIEKLQGLFREHPALGRFVFLAFAVPWLIHMHAVLLLWFERGTVGSSIVRYTDALHHITIVLVTQDPPPSITTGGYVMWLCAVLLALGVVATVIGNSASLFFGLDENRRELEGRLGDWHQLFAKFPGVFSAALKRQIIAWERDRVAELREGIERHERLITSVPLHLESQIIAALSAELAQRDDERLRKLLERVRHEDQSG